MDCPSPCGFRPGMQLALREQLMKPGSAPRPTQWGARGPAEGGAAQRGAAAAPMALLAGSRPAFDRPPSCRCLWLSPWHKQPVSRPGACLRERWRLQQNQPFLFQETHATWKAAPRPPRSVCVAPHTSRDTRVPHPGPCSNDRATHRSDHPGCPTSRPPAGLHIGVGALVGGKKAAGGGTRTKPPLWEARAGRVVAVPRGSMRRTRSRAERLWPPSASCSRLQSSCPRQAAEPQAPSAQGHQLASGHEEGMGWWLLSHPVFVVKVLEERAARPLSQDDGGRGLTHTLPKLFASHPSPGPPTLKVCGQKSPGIGNQESDPGSASWWLCDPGHVAVPL